MATIKTLNKRRKKKLNEMFARKHEKWMEKQKTQEERYKYNPPPSRTLESQKEVDAKRRLEKKEQQRTASKASTNFVPWEYRDRQSHKKLG